MKIDELEAKLSKPIPLGELCGFPVVVGEVIDLKKQEDRDDDIAWDVDEDDFSDAVDLLEVLLKDLEELVEDDSIILPGPVHRTLTKRKETVTKFLDKYIVMNTK